MRRLDCCGGRVVDGAVAIVAVAVVSVEEWAVCYIVTRLATLEAGVLPFAVIHQRTLVVELVPGVSVAPRPKDYTQVLSNTGYPAMNA